MDGVWSRDGERGREKKMNQDRLAKKQCIQSEVKELWRDSKR